MTKPAYDDGKVNEAALFKPSEAHEQHIKAKLAGKLLIKIKKEGA